MGNCQAIDAATLVIQHPCGKSEKIYWTVTAAEVMKTNPGHYVALLISSTLCPSSNDADAPTSTDATENQVRVTQIKLLRPTDTLVLGQVYRLITAKEVMKVWSAKKHAKMMRQGKEIRVEEGQQQQQQQHETRRPNHLPNVRKKGNLVDNQERQRQQKPTSSTGTTSNSAIGRSRSWQPSLRSISEAV